VTVVNRNGLLERDDGVCKNAYTLEFFGGVGPSRTATCKPNEVEIPDTIGHSLAWARMRLEGQPLTPAVVYKPAKTGDRVGYVVGQTPKRGTASAYDKITLVSEKSLHGVVPRVVGLPLVRAERRLAKLRLKVIVKGAARGKVVTQSKLPHTASAPGEQIVLTVKA
jgi:beta-lactam-binding protein with PASTA domain